MNPTAPTAPVGGIVREVVTAARDTRLLLSLRWRYIRTAKSRVYLVLGFLGLFGALAIATQAGTAVRRYAEQGMSTTAGQFASNYVSALKHGELGTLGATTIGSVFVIAFMAPLTGAAMQALASPDDLTGLRPTRLHRYFDALACNAISAIGFFQLITLTVFGSLMTLDGGRVGAVLFMWLIWPFLILMTTSEGWAIELLTRRYGISATRTIGVLAAALLAVAVWLDPNHGRTLFGLGTAIINTLTASADGNIAVVAQALALVAAVAFLALLGGLAACRAALALPAPARKKERAPRRLFPISKRPSLALLQLLLVPILRSSEVRRPLATIIIVGLPAVWISPSTNIMTTLVVAVPLSIALAFGVNIFGVLGPGMTWMASQPRLMSRLLTFTTIIQVTVTLAVAALLWAPVTLVGHINLADAAAVAAGTVVSTAFTTRSSAHKAITQPILVRLGTRGDVVVPPVTAINYTFRFALWSGQLGVLVMSQDGWLQLALVAIGLTWTTLRFRQLARKWRRRDIQAAVTVQVSAT